MTLYSYDHCPYCVKARMIFGLKKKPIEVKTLLNDDEKTPIDMIGVKMLPVLEYEAGKFMPESMDIVEFIDKKFSPQEVEASEQPELMDWLNKNALLNYKLSMPRWIRASLEEFETASARDYFEKKKTSYIGSFKERLEESSTLISEIEKSLCELELLIKEENSFYKKQASWNDFHLFPFLRSLSIVKALSFPPKTKKYMENLSELCKIPLYFSKAN